MALASSEVCLPPGSLGSISGQAQFHTRAALRIEWQSTAIVTDLVARPRAGDVAASYPF